MSRGAGRERASMAGVAALGALGAFLGLSQVFHGLYDETVWGPVALGALLVLLVLATAAPRRIPLGAVLALLGLAIWSLVSSSWGDSADAAWSAADRWLLYAAGLAVMLWMIAGHRERAAALLLGFAVGVMAVGIGLLVHMLAGHGASLFFSTRLNDPLGYVNGQAGYLLVAVWPCCALAEQRRFPALAALGMGGGVLLVGLGALAHSRGWAFGLACSLVAVVAAMPGRRRRLVIIAGVALAIFLIHGWLAQTAHGTVTSDAAARHAAAAIGVAALVATAVWGILVWALERAAPDGGERRAGVRRAGTVVLALMVLAGAIALGAAAGRISHTVRSDYNAFVHLAPNPSSSRFFSGGGNRYDYWRVAWKEFRSEPLRGVGAGSYSPGYYRYRRTTESITQPHSIEMQTLAELGLVGFALLLVFIGAVAWSAIKVARSASLDPLARFVGVAGTGMFVAWLAHTSVDWLHLLPGLTLGVLGGVAALQSCARSPEAVRDLAGRARTYPVLAAAVIACLGAIVIVPRIFSLDAESSARAALQHGDARGAIRDATRALEYDRNSVEARVLRAAAFARFDAFALARADLQQALRTEPHRWTTWALLGDLLTRRGDTRAARAAYRRAQALDPLDVGIAHS